MATPPMIAAGFGFTLQPDSPAQFSFLTKNPDGTALDVSSGYTIKNATLIPAVGINPGFNGALDIGTLITPTFSSTGVLINISGANAVSIANMCEVLSYNLYISLSNDSNVTETLAALGQMLIDGNSFFALS